MVDDRSAMDIAQLVAEHHQAVYRYAYRLTGVVADAEDLTQQVFLAAHEKLGQLRKAESARSWLFAILRNSFLKMCRKRRPIPADNLQLDMDTVPAQIPDSSDIDRERLQRALDELPAKFRMVVAMFYYEGCSYREISDRLEVPMGTVMSRLARAKGFLRSKLFPASSGTAVAAPTSSASQGG
jgi:RNA polymerase sigma-70 factor (ECF subfamily)